MKKITLDLIQYSKLNKCRPIILCRLVFCLYLFNRINFVLPKKSQSRENTSFLSFDVENFEIINNPKIDMKEFTTIITIINRKDDTT